MNKYFLFITLGKDLKGTDFYDNFYDNFENDLEPDIYLLKRYKVLNCMKIICGML